MAIGYDTERDRDLGGELPATQIGEPALSQIIPRRTKNKETGSIEGEHAIATGQTRYGKTYLSKRIAAHFRHVIVFDPKRRYFLDREHRRIANVEQLYDTHPDRDPWIVYAPPVAEANDPRAHEELCAFVFKRGGCLFVIDEIVRMSTASKYPPHLRYLYTGGAEEGICVLGLTQEPIRVPSFCYTQAAHHYLFRTANKSHREKLEGFVPIDPEQIEQLHKKEFYYWRDDFRDPIGPLYL